MTVAIWAAAIIGGLAISLQLCSIAIAIVRCRWPTRYLPPPADAPPITIIRPVCGLDNFVDATLRSTFTLDYPRYEVLFCAVSTRDPVVGLVQTLIAEHPHVSAALLIGDERISANPKLNNVLKGWRAAANERIVMADSNLLLPRDYLQRLLAAFKPDTGMVSAPPIGSRPRGFWAEMECVFLNTYQARWQYAADTIGLGFAQGKTLFYRRSAIEAAGGLRALAAEAAEDAASTKIMRASKKRVRLVDAPFDQPLGERVRADVWDRQVRWARLRRDSFRSFYCLEIGAGIVPPLTAVIFLALASGHSVITATALLLALWYGAEMLLAAAAGWHLPPLYPLQAMARDVMLPVLWFEGWREAGFVWRGNAMSVDEEDQAKAA
ncbi:MAG: glycosyltransferase [Xanthobacteraceae bacterium]|nr:glycosyltransferase [Xanthobacteraceae bacterium]